MTDNVTDSTETLTPAEAFYMAEHGMASVEAMQVLAAEVKRLQTLLWTGSLEKQAAIDESFVR